MFEYKQQKSWNFVVDFERAEDLIKENALHMQKSVKIVFVHRTTISYL